MTRKKQSNLTPQEKLAQRYKRSKRKRPPEDLSHRNLSPAEKLIVMGENKSGKISYFQRRRLAILQLKKSVRESVLLTEIPTELIINLVNVETGVVLKSADSPWVLLAYAERNNLISMLNITNMPQVIMSEGLERVQIIDRFFDHPSPAVGRSPRSKDHPDECIEHYSN